MATSTIYCPGGAISQTGTAATARYAGCTILDCGKIPEVQPLLNSNSGPYVIPIWNSHQGEVKAAEYVWDHIQESKIKITDIWPGKIDFWFVKRSGASTAYNKIGSVKVAKTQCSGFIAKQKTELIERELTTIAHQEFREGAQWDGVLVAPGQGNDEPGFEVSEIKTANPNNFTSFVRFIPTRAFMTDSRRKVSWLSGVTMPSFGITLADTVHTFFDRMLSLVTDVNDIPKLVFVFDRTAKVGLLFDGAPLIAGDLLDAKEIEYDEITVYEKVGVAFKSYSAELHDLVVKEFPNLHKDDFILHHGVNTCMFACPPLGIYTHGFKAETVEPVVRFLISKLFQRWDEGAQCSQMQKVFFNRHKKAWLRNNLDFVQFTNISSTNK